MKHKTSAFTSTPTANEYWEDYRRILLGTFNGRVQQIANAGRDIFKEYLKLKKKLK